VLLIAESPPAQDEHIPKFFYYDEDDLRKVEKGSLFGVVMTELYPDEWKKYEWTGENVGKNKHIMLTRFSEDGFYLIDATDEPLQGKERTEKRRKLRTENESGKFVEKLTSLAERSYLSPNTEIYIISSLAYKIFYKSLVETHISSKGVDFILKENVSSKKIPLPFGKDNNNVVRFRSFIGYLRRKFKIG
jgi:hypothetical protein